MAVQADITGQNAIYGQLTREKRQMPRAKTNEFWVRQIKEFARNRRELRPPAIHRLLTDMVKSGSLQAPIGVEPVPSAKTIGRILKEFVAAPEAEQKDYDWFRWPESLLEKRLPWESSRAVLDLLDWTAQHNWPRPTVQQAEWFWRITLASGPDMPIGQRYDLALQLSGDISEFNMRFNEKRLASKMWLSQPEIPPSFELLPQSELAREKSYGEWVPVTGEKKQKGKSHHGRHGSTAKKRW